MSTPVIKETEQDETVAIAERTLPASFEEKSSCWLRRYELISRQPFFKGLSAEQLELLTDDALELKFVPGHNIFREGGEANRFFLILEGCVVLESETEEGCPIPIQTLGPGDDLGWSWLFPPYTLQFSARAVEPTKAIFFYGTRLRARCEADHNLGFELMKRIAEVMMKRLQSTRRQLMLAGHRHHFTTTFGMPPALNRPTPFSPLTPLSGDDGARCAGCIPEI